jgi:hypothetical protein
LGDFFTNSSGHPGIQAPRTCFVFSTVSQPHLPTPSRVTRLGEFLHFGRLFTLGSVLKLCRSSAKFLATFSTVLTMYVLILTKYGWG